MPDPVPVPLTDIEAEVMQAVIDQRLPRIAGAHWSALCDALRIAVKALEEDGREDTYDVPAVPRGYKHRVALAAVRELVDLGEKP